MNIVPGQNGTTPDYSAMVMHNQDNTLRFELHYRVTCDVDYYGPNCNKLCKATDNDSGHYTCSGNGDKICLTGDQCDLTNPCLPENPCRNNGTCVVKKGSWAQMVKKILDYKCLCQPGFWGILCGLRVATTTISIPTTTMEPTTTTAEPTTTTAEPTTTTAELTTTTAELTTTTAEPTTTTAEPSTTTAEPSTTTAEPSTTTIFIAKTTMEPTTTTMEPTTTTAEPTTTTAEPLTTKIQTTSMTEAFTKKETTGTFIESTLEISSQTTSLGSASKGTTTDKRTPPTIFIPSGPIVIKKKLSTTESDKVKTFFEKLFRGKYGAQKKVKLLYGTREAESVDGSPVTVLQLRVLVDSQEINNNEVKAAVFAQGVKSLDSNLPGPIYLGHLKAEKLASNEAKSEADLALIIISVIVVLVLILLLAGFLLRSHIRRSRFANSRIVSKNHGLSFTPGSEGYRLEEASVYEYTNPNFGTDTGISENITHLDMGNGVPSNQLPVDESFA